MMLKREIVEWLNALPEGAEIGIDDGGIALVAADSDAYIEVGGIPQEGK